MGEGSNGPSLLLIIFTLVAAGLVAFAISSLMELRKTTLGSNLLRPSIRVKERKFKPSEGKLADSLKYFNRREFVVMCAICDTLLPSFNREDLEGAVNKFVRDLIGEDSQLPIDQLYDYFEYGAIEADLPVQVCRVMEQYLPPDLILQIRLVMRTLENPLGLFFLTGVVTTKRFSDLPFERRETALINMLTSRIAPLRGAALALKAVAGRIYHAKIPEASNGGKAEGAASGNGKQQEGAGGVANGDGPRVNPAWKALGYDDRTMEQMIKTNGGPLPKPRLKMASRDVSQEFEGGGDPDVRELTCDVVIVGSGAGGGTAAGVLTAAGFKVVVLERGKYCSEEDFAKMGEVEACQSLYDNGGWIATEEMSVTMLAGSCVGGGTTVNWAASFRTPRHVLHEWSHRFGLKSFESAEYKEAEDAVCRRCNVNIEHSHRNDSIKSVPGLVVNLNNEKLCEAARSSGLEGMPIPRNVKNCKDCTGCERGCPYGAKQSTLTTFLEDAQKTGNLTIYEKAHVNKVIIEDGKAVGVLASVKESVESRYKLVVHARHAVIAAAGSLHTPALLLRSGMTHRKIGRHLALHPVCGMAGMYPKASMQHHRGVGMGTYIRDYMDLDGHGYGAVIETPPSHAGISGVLVPWNNAFAYRMVMVMKEQLAVTIPITRDRSSSYNKVFIDSAGRPRIRYLLTPQDSKNLTNSILAVCRLQKKNGGKVIMPIFEQIKAYKQIQEDRLSFKDYLKYVEGLGTPLGNSQLFSAHQMGSCRMSPVADQGVVDEEGQTHEVQGLYIVDASVFPTSLGINPMMTIQAVSFMLAKKLATKLKGDIEAVDKRYCQPTPEEAAGRVCFPDGPTLKNDYGVSCKEAW